jgi:hypothetical protein
VSNRVSRRQANRWAGNDQAAYYEQPQYAAPQYAAPQYAAPQYAAPPQYSPPPAPAAVAPSGDPALAKLRQLADLHEQGILTDEEFAAQKARILGG